MKIAKGTIYALSAIGWFTTAYDHEPYWLVSLGLALTGLTCVGFAMETFFPWLKV